MCAGVGRRALKGVGERVAVASCLRPSKPQAIGGAASGSCVLQGGARPWQRCAHARLPVAVPDPVVVDAGIERGKALSGRPHGRHASFVAAACSCLATHHIDMMLALALAGAGIAGLPSFAALPAIRDGRLQRVLPDWRGTVLRLFAAVSARRHLPARTRLFVDFLVERFGGEECDPWLSALLPAGQDR